MEASVQETGTVATAPPTGVRAPVMPLAVPLLLSLPVWIPLIVAVTRAWLSGRAPTAFIAYDLAYYAANGRQHFEQGFHLFYNNPYANYGTPAIYFQPHLFLLGLLQWIGLTPDVAFVVFGIGMVAFASIMAGKFYQEWAGWRTTPAEAWICLLFLGRRRAVADGRGLRPVGTCQAHQSLFLL